MFTDMFTGYSSPPNPLGPKTPANLNKAFILVTA